MSAPNDTDPEDTGKGSSIDPPLAENPAVPAKSELLFTGENTNANDQEKEKEKEKEKESSTPPTGESGKDQGSEGSKPTTGEPTGTPTPPLGDDSESPGAKEEKKETPADQPTEPTASPPASSSSDSASSSPETPPAPQTKTDEAPTPATESSSSASSPDTPLSPPTADSSAPNTDNSSSAPNTDNSSPAPNTDNSSSPFTAEHQKPLAAVKSSEILARLSLPKMPEPKIAEPEIIRQESGPMSYPEDATKGTSPGSERSLSPKGPSPTGSSPASISSEVPSSPTKVSSPASPTQRKSSPNEVASSPASPAASKSSSSKKKGSKHSKQKRGKHHNRHHSSSSSKSRKKKTGLDAETVKIGILGAGKMAEALVKGLVEQVKVDAKRIVVAAPTTKNSAFFKGLGCHFTKRNYDVFTRYDCDVIFLAFHGSVIKYCYTLGGERPHPITTNFLPHNSHHLHILSMVSGVTLAKIKPTLLSPEHPERYKIGWHRIMFNAAIAYGLGLCAIDVEPDSTKISSGIRALLTPLGRLEYLPESQMDAACALGGSGLAFGYYLLGAMADGAFKMGLSRNIAIKFASKTVQCASQVLIESSKHPNELKDAVCSVGGPAIYGLHVLDKDDVQAGIVAAVESAHRRANALAVEDVSKLSN